jgi:hypothetical protein
MEQAIHTQTHAITVEQQQYTNITAVEQQTQQQ